MLIDAHVHIDKYGAALPVALEEIRTERILTVATAMDVPSYLEAKRIAEGSELILPTFGIHPSRAAEYARRLPEISRQIDASPALGEIGLDYHWVKDRSAHPAQRRVLAYFLGAAREQNKLVNLHTKGAEREILELLEQYDIRRAIIHWYSGPLDILRALAESGAYFTVGVELLFSGVIRQIAEAIPNRLLLTETDNPGGLKWLQGSAGMPVIIKQVVDALATVKSVTATDLTAMIQQNFSSLIADDPWLEPFAMLLSG